MISVPVRRILFVHEGREAYPEIAAYRDFFSARIETSECHPSALGAQGDLAACACWFIMGFYPRRPPGAGRVIHDYRSLSIGRGRWLKDRIKRAFNARPDVRIFQNEAMRKALGFEDGVPSVLLPMGVPPFARPAPGPLPAPRYDFVYIGVVSAERRSHLMIDSFLKRYGGSKSLTLFGPPAPEFEERYKEQPSVVFAGRLPQPELFEVLRAARAAVNYFPGHAPHLFQTPTKLLEYAALGLRVLSNDHPQSRATAQRHGIASLWGPAEDMFAHVPDALDWPDNRGFDPAPLLWPRVIGDSGIESFLGGGEGVGG